MNGDIKVKIIKKISFLDVKFQFMLVIQLIIVIFHKFVFIFIMVLNIF